LSLQLGLDTGGTYTDAVLVDDSLAIRATAKSLTTHRDLVVGLSGAVDQVLVEHCASDINLVCLSTTLATNALVEGRGRRVALILAGFKDSQLKRANLADALHGDPFVLVSGGHQASGIEQAALDITGVRQFIAEVDHKVDAYAVSAVFAVRNADHERQLQTMIEQLTGKPVARGQHLSNGCER